MGCPASIKVQLSSDGQYLEIKSMSNEHLGHDQSQVILTMNTLLMLDFTHVIFV